MEKNKIIIAISIILGLLVLTIGGYVIYNNLNQKQDTQDNTSLKLDSSKDYIYDANYEYSVSKDSYTNLYDDTYYVKDIIVPYINIDSNSAKQANKELKNVFNTAISTYNKGIDDGYTFVDKCNYEKYNTKDVVSVVLTYSVGGTDAVRPNYYSYNFNINNGNLLTFEEVYKLAGLNSTNIDSKVQEAITATMNMKLKNFIDSTNEIGMLEYPEGTSFVTYNNESLDNYKNSVKNNTIKYFIDSDNKLNIIVTLSLPTIPENLDTIIKVN